MHAEVMAQSEPMQLEDLLKTRGLDLASHSVTLMRHTDGEFPVRRHVGTHALTLYQARQDIEHPVGSLMVGFWGHRVDHGLHDRGGHRSAAEGRAHVVHLDAARDVRREQHGGHGKSSAQGLGGRQ